jgi:hypothetical protein
MCKTKKRCGVALTVHGDGDALGQDEAVLALEGGDLSELVELQVVGRDTLSRLGLDELNLEAILLCDCEERSGARVALSNYCQESCLEGPRMQR